MPVLTMDAIAGHVYAVGLRGEPAAIAVALTGPESSFNTTAHNVNSKTGDDSYGLWQINMLGSLAAERRRRYNLKANTDLYDPATNARAMYDLSGGGTNWAGPWHTSFTGGKHRKYLEQARAAVAAVESRSGAVVAAGGLPLEASTPGPLAGETLPPGGNLGFGIANVSSAFPRIGVEGATVADMDRISRMGVQGNVSYSASSVAQVVLTFPDPFGEHQVWRYFPIYAGARYGDMRLVVAGVDWVEIDGVPAVTVTLRPIAVDGLRSTDPKSPSVQWANLSPTEVLAERARFVGLRFYGKATARRDSITRLGVDDAGASVAETDWDMGQRLAKEEGFWLFESGDALYFAPPSWLADHTTTFEARYGSTGAARIWETLAFPEARSTLDESPYGKRALGRTMTLKLPRWRGEQVRPGMCCNYKGTPGFEMSIDNTRPLPWVVTGVDWPFDGGISPVTVELTEGIDPVAQPPAAEVGLQATTTGTGSLAEAAFNGAAAAGPSNGGKGSYGYQYDAVGDTPAKGEQPGTRVMMNHLLNKFPKSHDSGTFVARTVDGTSSLSVHAEGRAGDSGVPVSSALGTQIADYLVANAPLFGIQYVIWNARSWNAKTRAWKTYAAPNGRTDNTSLHRDHVHWELCWEAARYLNDAAIRGGITGGGTGAAGIGGGGSGGGGGSF